MKNIIYILIFSYLFIGCVRAEFFNEVFSPADFEDVVELHSDGVDIQYRIKFVVEGDRVRYECYKDIDSRTVLINEITYSKKLFLDKINNWKNNIGQEYFCIEGNDDMICSGEILNNLIKHIDEG